MPFGEEMPLVAQDTMNKRQFTGHERDDETGDDYMMARYYGSSFNRFLSPDPLAGHLLIPQTLNRYVYAGNSPVRFTDLTGLDFYLQCSDTGTEGCDKNGHAGRTTTDENGNTQFTPTIVSEDKDSGELVDNNGDTYTAEVDSKGVHFTNQNSGDVNTGTWQKGSSAVNFEQDSGALAGFSFQFTQNPNTGQTSAAIFGFAGTREAADIALKKAGLKPVWDIQQGDSFKSADPNNKHNVAHFIITSGQNTPVSGHMHTGESRGKDHIWPAIADFFEWASGYHPGGDE